VKEALVNQLSFNVRLFAGLACILIGLLELTQAFRTGQLTDAYKTYGLFFIAGLGVLAGRLILMRQNSLASSNPRAGQLDSGLFSSICRLRATNLTSFLAGIWFALSGYAIGLLVSLLDLPDGLRVSSIMVAAIAVALGPALIFESNVPNYAYGGGLSPWLKRFGTRKLRLLCWFLGALAASYAMRALGVKL
jgi:hypothetical protein